MLRGIVLVEPAKLGNSITLVPPVMLVHFNSTLSVAFLAEVILSGNIVVEATPFDTISGSLVVFPVSVIFCRLCGGLTCFIVPPSLTHSLIVRSPAVVFLYNLYWPVGISATMGAVALL